MVPYRPGSDDTATFLYQLVFGMEGPADAAKRTDRRNQSRRASDVAKEARSVESKSKERTATVQDADILDLKSVASDNSLEKNNDDKDQGSDDIVLHPGRRPEGDEPVPEPKSTFARLIRRWTSLNPEQIAATTKPAAKGEGTTEREAQMDDIIEQYETQVALVARSGGQAESLDDAIRRMMRDLPDSPLPSPPPQPRSRREGKTRGDWTDISDDSDSAREANARFRSKREKLEKSVREEERRNAEKKKAEDEVAALKQEQRRAAKEALRRERRESRASH